MEQLRKQLGNIDIYLFDQIIKGNYEDCQKILDVGCGAGRNLVYFLQNGFDVYAIDPSPESVAIVKKMARELAPALPESNFILTSAESLPFEDANFDLVICSAVLHFARSEEHFDAMLRSIWRVLKPGGLFFARLASDIGLEMLALPTGNGRYLLPDGTERFLVNEKMLMDYTRSFNAKLYEPIKTTNVQNMRCMTTWCLQKR